MTPGERVRAALLAAVPVAALLAQGAVLPGEKAVVAGAVALLGGLLLLPGLRIGAGARWGLGLLAAAGLLSGVGVVVPDATARTAGTAWAAALAAYALVAVGAAPPRATWARGLAWATVAWAALGLAHAATGTSRVLGLWEARPGLEPWFGPLVNPNHHGLLLLAGLPFVVDEARRARPLAAAVLGATALWAVAFPAVVASMGLVVALGGVGAFALLGARLPWRVRVGGLAAGGALVVGGAALVTRVQPEWWALSAAPRLQQWADAAPMLGDHAVGGVGLGAYEASYVRYRTVLDFARFEHAHSDVVEWAVETGGLGLMAGLAALALALPAWLRAPRPFALSLLAVAAHAAVDFPLHVPGVALVAVLLAVLTLRGEAVQAPTERRVRGALAGGVLGVGLGASLLLSRRAEVLALAARALAGEAAPADLDRLAALAPDRAEVQLARLEAAPSVDAARAVLEAPWPSGLLLARTAASLVRLGELELAERTLLRSLLEQPNDYRAWRLLAIVRERRGDPVAAADAWAEALRRWPRKILDDEDPFEAAFRTVPLGSYWLHALADAPAVWSARLSRKMLTLGRYDVALDACRQAGRLRPAAHARMAECAEALVGLGRREDALAYVRTWTAEAPGDVWGWVARARVVADGPEVGAEEVAAVLRARALRPDHGAVRRLVREARARAEACTAEGTCPSAAPLLRLAADDAAR